MSQQCVDIDVVLSYVDQRLTGQVVGYACCVGSAAGSAYTQGGNAQQEAGKPVQPFLAATKFSPASVAKALTALAAIQLLTRPGSPTLDSPIGDWLPQDWIVATAGTGATSVAEIKFQELLSHRSGIRDATDTYTTPDFQEFVPLRSFFNQDPPLLLTDKSPSYSNVGFALFRILLPLVDGMQDDITQDDASRAAKFADAYESIVNQYVFNRVGVTGASTSAPQAPYALGYTYPGSTPGYDWAKYPLHLTAGAGGWWMSIDDIQPVLDDLAKVSLTNVDGHILTAEQWNQMQGAWNQQLNPKVPLGFDNLISPNAPGYTWIQKDGGDTGVSASIAIFGSTTGSAPVANAPFYGALFINSDISATGPNQQSGWRYCHKCGALVYTGNPAKGKCPAGGNNNGDHDTSGSSTYVLDLNVGDAGAQRGWRWCSNCQALCFTSSPSVCSAGSTAQPSHEFASSGQYFLDQTGGAKALERQDGWLWCKKCQVMTHGGGPCAAGSSHDTSSSGDYFIQWAIGADTVLLEAFEAAVAQCPPPPPPTPAPDPCQEIRDELNNISPGDFNNPAAYEAARVKLVAALAQCERLHG
jgi:CubicO group peptidase (beta-lactamase class C family)